MPYQTDYKAYEDIQPYLHTEGLGYTVLLTRSTGSTNDDAKTIGAEYPSGTVFIAETQTGGKGRIGRQWTSPRGGLYMTVVLKPTSPPSQLPVLSIVAGYSVAKAIRDVCGLETQLKWPNDVLCQGHKICGVLCEMVVQPVSSSPEAALVVIGIGVNVNLDLVDLPPEVRENASTLRVLLGHDVDRNRLAAAILNRLEPNCHEFLHRGLEPFRDDINSILAYRAGQVVIRNVTTADQQETQGILMGIDNAGRALIAVTGSDFPYPLAFSAGDLTLRPR